MFRTGGTLPTRPPVHRMPTEARQQAVEAALRATAQLVCYRDPAGELSLHGAAEALTGRPAEAFVRLEDLLEIVHEDERDLIASRCESYGRSPDAREHRVRFVHPDGTLLACEVRITRLAPPPGEEDGEEPLVVSMRALPPPDPRQESHRLGRLIEYLPDYVSIHSTDGRCLSMNAAGRRMLGIGRGEDIRRLGFTDIIADSTSAPAHLLLSVVMSHGSHSTDVILIDRRDGRHVPAAWSASLVSDGAQASRHVVCIARDMSEQLEIEWELRQNQKRLTHALDVSRLGEWSMDIHRQASSQSRRVSEIFGYRDASEPWNYRVFLAHVHPDDRDRVDRAFTRALETGCDLDFETRIKRTDGELRWISAKASTNRGLDGDGRHIGGVIQDITTRKFAERRDRFLADVSVPLNTLSDNRSMLEQVARLALPFLADHCSIDLSRPDGTLERIVATHSLLSGEAVGDAEGGQSLPPLLRHMLDTRQPLIFDLSEPARLEGFARTRSERLSLRALHVTGYLGVPLILRQRQLGVLHFYRSDPEAPYDDKDRQLGQELASRVAVALDNARLYQALQDSDRRKDEFLAMLSHELRNPLESLSVGVSLIEDEPGEQQLEWARSMMRGQIDRLSGILEDLLDVSRYTFNKVVLQREETVLQPLLEQVLDEMRGRAEARGYRVALDLCPEPLHAEIDPIRIGQVISNLLTNAVKYGAERGEIALSMEYEAGRAVIAVSDEGIGIAVEELPNVFELFSQVETTIDRSLGGLGMGLTLVRRIVEMHGGSVTALSDGVDRGTRFVVSLPAALERRTPERAASADGAFARGRASAATALRSAADVTSGNVASEPTLALGTSTGGVRTDRGEGEPGTDGRTGDEADRPADTKANGEAPPPRRLMLVDDNIETVTALQKLFGMKGYEVRVAHDGLAAISLAETFEPEAAVLDIGLPGANGYEVASALRERYGERSLLLVALSGYGQEDDRARSREAGFDHHLLKPASFRALMDLVATA